MVGFWKYFEGRFNRVLKDWIWAVRKIKVVGPPAWKDGAQLRILTEMGKQQSEQVCGGRSGVWFWMY